MIRESFNTGWGAGPHLTGFARMTGSSERRPVTLPYDVVRDLPRSHDAAAGGGAFTGYFPGGYFEYVKTFDVPEGHRGKTVVVEFEGVYRDAVVFVNGEFVAQRPNGYTDFAVTLDPWLRYGEPNTIQVECRAHEDSRWYSGAGIHRDTWMAVADLVHVPLDGLRVTTPDVDGDRAVVAVATTVHNQDRTSRTVRVQTRVLDGAGSEVARGSAPVTLLPGRSEVVRARLRVPRPELWSVDDPNLYSVETTLEDGDRILDEARTTFGIRTLQLDPERGLRINGEPADLRGACIHSDAGLLGAAAIGRAEERRVEILKAAGFNAIRSAHNPISRATLHACDRIGMLVMDEYSDIWTKAKSPFDYALAFPEWWERDIEAMVAKDLNHPSVIMYSIGNEIPEVGTSIGSTWGRRLAEKVRSLDDTRFVTNGINPLAAVADRIGEVINSVTDGAADLNTVIASMGELMNRVGASEAVSTATEESASVLDVVGWNYADSRHALEQELFPDRIVVGSETFPGHIDELWRLVQAHPHVIGDFTWTGWDYLGETGIGRVDYPEEGYERAATSGAPYPWLTAWVGDIDITGHRRPASYYRETVFGRRTEPYIAVHRPQFHGRPTHESPWAWSDSVSSWSWDVPAGSPVTVDVYSDADEVELFLVGRSVGCAAVGADKPFRARFEIAYEPGELIAVARTGGTERARTALQSTAGPLRLAATPDREVIRADADDLAYVVLTLQDDAGTVPCDQDRRLSVEVSGSGELAGLGSADPRTEDPFGGTECATFDGRALAIVRPTGPGEISVQVTAADCEPVTATMRADR